MVVNRAPKELCEEGVNWQWGWYLPYKALSGTGGGILMAEEDLALARKEAQGSVGCKDSAR